MAEPNEEILAALLETADEAFVAILSEDGRDGRCRLAGRRLGELFGVDPATLVGRPEAEVIERLARSCEEPEALRALVEAPGAGQRQGELELMRPTVRIVLWRSAPILGPHGPIGWLGAARDVTRERSAERRAQQLLLRLEQMTAIDALTRLPNKRRFDEELEREHGRAMRAWDSYAILRIDVDDLAAANAELGLTRGDEILEAVAARLREGRREYDLLARLGGDEIALLIPGADAIAARTVAQRAAQAVSAEPVDVGEHRTVTVSIGGAVWVPPSGESGADVLARAGEALVCAKRRGRHAIEIDEGARAQGG